MKVERESLGVFRLTCHDLKWDGKDCDYDQLAYGMTEAGKRILSHTKWHESRGMT
ncbi:MAG: hypothetical protein WCB19_02270 [Thermoplasmata archaeon]